LLVKELQSERMGNLKEEWWKMMTWGMVWQTCCDTEFGKVGLHTL
jgi:hypothetical protein